jgi:hypothetical protein
LDKSNKNKDTMDTIDTDMDSMHTTDTMDTNRATNLTCQEHLYRVEEERNGVHENTPQSVNGRGLLQKTLTRKSFEKVLSRFGIVMAWIGTVQSRTTSATGTVGRRG